jgi:hypothetical protein
MDKPFIVECVIHPPPDNEINGEVLRGPTFREDELPDMQRALTNKPVWHEHNHHEEPFGKVLSEYRRGKDGSVIGKLEIDREKGKHIIDGIQRGELAGVSMSTWMMRDSKGYDHLAPFEVSVVKRGDFPGSNILSYQDGDKKMVSIPALIEQVLGHTPKSRMSDQAAATPAAAEADQTTKRARVDETDPEKEQLRIANANMANMLSGIFKAQFDDATKHVKLAFQDDVTKADILVNGITNFFKGEPANPEEAPKFVEAMASFAKGYQGLREQYAKEVEVRQSLEKEKASRVVVLDNQPPKQEEYREKIGTNKGPNTLKSILKRVAEGGPIQNHPYLVQASASAAMKEEEEEPVPKKGLNWDMVGTKATALVNKANAATAAATEKKDE